MLVNVPRLQAKMDEQGLDGIVATTLANVHYFAGFRSVALSMFPYDGQCYAVVTRDEPILPWVVSSTVELDQVLDGFPVKGTVNFGKFFREGPFTDVDLTEDEKGLKAISMDVEPAANPLEGLIRAIENAGLYDKRIGVDELGLLSGFLEALSERLPRAQFVEVSQLLRWVRKVKTLEEIHRLREAARMTEQAIMAAAAIVREGVKEYELVREFERSIVTQDGTPHFTFIRIGRNAVAGQRMPDSTTLKKGDTIWFDTGAIYQGYCSDIARIFSLGEPSNRARDVYAAMLAGEEAGIAKTRVGMTGGELFETTMEASRQAGLPDYRRHHVGHGIGAEVYEPPLLAPDNEDVIEEGSVINIETPYYEFGLGALHVEDPYVVGANGKHELLTTLERHLHIVGA